MIDFDRLVKEVSVIEMGMAEELLAGMEDKVASMIRKNPEQHSWQIARIVSDGEDRARALSKFLNKFFVSMGKTQLEIFYYFNENNGNHCIKFKYTRKDI